jgi:adenylate cyclase, class 2
MPDAMEIETKFVIPDPMALRRKLNDLGAASEGRVFERNIRLDTPDRRLTAQGIILRVRTSESDTQQHHLLTVKLRGEQTDPNIRAVREIETSIDDEHAMLSVLEALGYQKYWLYEKHRENFRWQNLTISLDELPYGWFLELEGNKEEIAEAASVLGLRMTDGLSLGYADIFDNLKHNLGLAIDDLTFAAFNGIAIEPGDYLVK